MDVPRWAACAARKAGRGSSAWLAAAGAAGGGAAAAGGGAAAAVSLGEAVAFAAGWSARPAMVAAADPLIAGMRLVGICPSSSWPGKGLGGMGLSRRMSR